MTDTAGIGGGYSIFADTMVDLPYPEIEKAAQRGAVVLLPVGVVEQHGPHLPLGVDIYGSYVLARLTRDELRTRGREAIIAPPFYWGVNHVTSGFAGSFRTRPEVARELLIDVCASLAHDGFDAVDVVNHQGDGKHAEVVLSALADVRQRGVIDARWLADDRVIERFRHVADDDAWLRYTRDVAGPDEAVPRPSEVLGVHAHDVETAMMLRWFPTLVDEHRLDQLPPTSLTQADLAEWRRGGEHAVRVTPDGYFGDPKPGDPDLWRLYVLQARGMAAAIDQAG